MDKMFEIIGIIYNDGVGERFSFFDCDFLGRFWIKYINDSIYVLLLFSGK